MTLTTMTTTTAMMMLVLIPFSCAQRNSRYIAPMPVSQGVPCIGVFLQSLCNVLSKSVHSAVEEHVGTNGTLWLQRLARLVGMKFSPCLHVFHIFHTMQVEMGCGDVHAFVYEPRYVECGGAWKI